MTRSSPDRRVVLPRMARPPKGAAHIGAVEILAKIHQRQKGAEDAGLQIVGKVKAAGGDASEALAMLGKEVHDLALALVTGVAESGFTPHFSATSFQRECEMQDAEALLGESLRRIELATGDLARGRRHKLIS